jgi:hypothetical protein
VGEVDTRASFLLPSLLCPLGLSVGGACSRGLAHTTHTHTHTHTPHTRAHRTPSHTQGYEVDIYESRPWIGGKVASFKDKDGNDIEMGLHVFFGAWLLGR